jgi:hypothetical protein
MLYNRAPVRCLIACTEQAVELINLRWDRLLLASESDVCAPLKAARSSAHISRRGGVMLRLIFPKGTAWNSELERAVVAECNGMLLQLRAALMGRALRLY